MGDDVEPPEAPTSVPSTERQALMRKVAQLTKVVMHLTSKNDEIEQEYQEVSEEWEAEVRLGFKQKIFLFGSFFFLGRKK